MIQVSGRAAIVALGFALVAPRAPLFGQRAGAGRTRAQSTACRIDTTAPWHRRQQEWLDESKHDWTNDSLRTALLRAANLDAPRALAVQLGVNVGGRGSGAGRGPGIDSIVAQLRRGGRGGPWPSRSSVGAAGARVVALAALADTTFTIMAMRRMEEAGPSESFAADVAVLEDRARVLLGRKQIYGTQFSIDQTGRVVLAPMEDSAHVDLRREDAGLPPFKLGLCLAAQR